MIEHDLTFWPVILTVAQGEPSLQEHQAFLADWGGWLDRDQPFATLRVFKDLASLKRPEGGAREAKVWLQRHGEQIRHLVIGMATVVPDAALAEIAKMDAQKLFGVPARSFSSEGEAAAWLAGLVSARAGDAAMPAPDRLVARIGAMP